MGMIASFIAADAATFTALRADPESIPAFLGYEDGAPPHALDLDKAWHGIHYMLTGTPDPTDDPVSWAVMGGEPVGEDIGYGPARLLEPEQVRRVAEALPDADAFRARFNPSAMAELYLGDVWSEEGDDALDYLMTYYEAMLAFYRAAAVRGDGIVLWIS